MFCSFMLLLKGHGPEFIGNCFYFLFLMFEMLSIIFLMLCQNLNISWSKQSMWHVCCTNTIPHFKKKLAMDTHTTCVYIYFQVIWEHEAFELARFFFQLNEGSVTLLIIWQTIIWWAPGPTPLSWEYLTFRTWYAIYWA